GPAPGDAPQQNRSAPRSACSVEVADVVAPASPRVCDTPEVTVTMAVTCPPVLPVHLVIAVDRSKSIADPSVSQILKEIQQSAREVIDAIDFEAHPDNRVGVVSHGFRVTVETELTSQKSRALGAVNGIKYLASDLGEDPGKAVDKARQMLEDGRGAGSPIEIILLYGDGCDPSESGCEAAAKRAAAQADARGMAVMARCFKESDRETCATSYRQMASQANFYFESSGQLPNRVKEVANQGKALKLSALTLLERLAPGLAYVAASGRPAPQVTGQDLLFTFGEALPKQTLVARYRVGRGAEGTTALRINAATTGINVVDSLNRTAGPIAVPTRELTFGPCVVDTPTATATPATVVAYLPVAMRFVCKPSDVHADVALVIDASSSMRDVSGGMAKIDAAKAAARAFIDVLDLGDDRAAVVAFNASASVPARLSADRGALGAAIDGIGTASGTRIDLALAAAESVLGEGAPRPGTNRVVVLLTDGRTDAGTDADALRAADVLKRAGVYIYTIGLGDDIDAGFLRTVASSPATYLQAPTAAQLADIYTHQIAGTLPCPGGVFWGGEGP
ncbi:MAG: VWA domain-containing protein, partial [Chloroflexi bacterium CFX6]|nr:VWA domain-containing protein [Chloroflexi bacterium CFX6]